MALYDPAMYHYATPAASCWQDMTAPLGVPCPQCGSHNTTQTAPFGSTACKALYRCLDCLEPFDYFKPY